MKTYLVTGGAGFIGSNFIQYIFEKYNDIQVINVDKLTYAGNSDNKNLTNRSNYYFYKVDINNREKITEIFEAYNIDYVVNFAAESHVDRSIENPDVFVKTNILGTQVLLDIARKFWSKNGNFVKGKKFIQISTDEVYGSINEGHFTELTPIAPRSPYSASKAAADLLVQSYFETYGMPINITRCSNNYGPYQFPEKLIPLIIHNCLLGKPIPIYGDGENVRDWIYVKDHCEAVDLIIKKGKIGDVYNIGSSNERRNIEIAKMILSFIRMELKNDVIQGRINGGLISFVADRKGHDWRYAIDASKIKDELGWYPKTSFNEGINETIKWYLQNQKWLKSSIKRG